MEARTITVVSTREQINVELSTTAETVAELKRDLEANGISYDDMTFYEGLTHTELIGDDAILPRDVNYKGEVTNHIVIMLTNSNKKIRSGATSTRVYLYDAIKGLHLENACIDLYGKSFTNCTNEELKDVVDRYSSTDESEEEEVDLTENASTYAEGEAVEPLVMLVQILGSHGALSNETTIAVLAALGCAPDAVTNSKYSQSEIAEMFSFLNR